MRLRSRLVVSGAIAACLLVTVISIWWCFEKDLAQARARAAQGSVVLATPCGPIEYQEAGAGMPLLAIHGSGGGHDQGMAFAGALALQGVRVIAMSRFGYLRTPMAADASAAAQADAHVCLLDALGIGQAGVLGGSAGAPSALALAIRHPDRVSALVLLVPLTYKPPTLADSAPPLPPWVESMMMRLIGSDFLYWSALQLTRDQLVRVVLATPPELLRSAGASERARISALLDNILPVSSRAEGLRSDTAAGKHLEPSALEAVHAPTLVISARDDRYGTYASAQYTASHIRGAKFIGFDSGGHTWVAHDDEVRAEILKLLKASETSFAAKYQCAFQSGEVVATEFPCEPQRVERFGKRLMQIYPEVRKINTGADYITGLYIFAMSACTGRFAEMTPEEIGINGEPFFPRAMLAGMVVAGREVMCPTINPSVAHTNAPA